MRSVQAWLDEYGESHRHPLNKVVHWVCVPVIMVSVLALLWSLPGWVLPAWLNWAVIAVAAALVYYALLSPGLALGMVPVSGFALLLVGFLDALPMPLWGIALVLFVAAWVGQFYGHHVEGKKPSFFKDVQFLLIGPVWLLAAVYRALRIPYR